MADQTGNTSQEFTNAAALSAEQVLVPIDKDLVDWFRRQGDLVSQINGLCRFSSVTWELEFEEELEKMQPAPSDPPTF